MEAAQTSLAAHIEWRDAGIVPQRHHKLLIDALEAIERRDLRKLMVFMPPGSAKSTYASVEFPPWYLGKRPGENVIAASHGEELAEHFGRQCRNIVADATYERLWGHSVANDSGAARRWATTKGGGYYAVGVGSSVTGRRGDLGLIDDPVKGRQQADSENEREKVWSWYSNDFMTRLKPNAVQVLIMTRWHEDDLAGRLLNQEGERWHQINLPMEAGENDPLGRKPGERLWSGYFTEEMVQDAKRDHRKWSALYQQNPTPDEGTFFKRDWFRRFDPSQPPAHLHKYLSSDHAPSGVEGNDSTCVRVWGLDPSGDLYLLDGFRATETMDASAERILGDKRIGRKGLIERHRPLCWFPEDDNNWKAVQGFVTKMMRERNTHCRIEPIKPHGADKAIRAQPFQAMASAGRVWIPQGPEGDEIISQYLQFPGGKHDDEVDAASVIGRALGMAHSGIAPPPQPKAKRDPWGDEDDEQQLNWKVA